VIDVESPIFFVCGPKEFMDNAREILSTLGAKRERILQESFGEPNGPRSLVHGKPAWLRLSCSFSRRRLVSFPPNALSWIWRRKTACRFRTVAARGYAASAQLEF
jgi:ferredoxin-NADP reductase